MPVPGGTLRIDADCADHLDSASHPTLGPNGAANEAEVLARRAIDERQAGAVDRNKDERLVLTPARNRFAHDREQRLDANTLVLNEIVGALPLSIILKNLGDPTCGDERRPLGHPDQARGAAHVAELRRAEFFLCPGRC
jgi:hypothetical protein